MVINALPAHMAELGIVAAQGLEGTVPATGLRVGVGRRHQGARYDQLASAFPLPLAPV